VPNGRRSRSFVEQLGLITASEKQPSSLGPARAELQATPEGRQAAEEWLRRPVCHPRDIRSELLVKVALLDRVGADPRDLLRAQRGQLAPVADGLAGQLRTATGFDHILALWRHESVCATLRFLDALLTAVPGQMASLPGLCRSPGPGQGRGPRSGDGDDDLAARVAFFYLAEGGGDAGQGVGPVDDGAEFARVDERDDGGEFGPVLAGGQDAEALPDEGVDRG